MIPGLIFEPAFLTKEEERGLLAEIEKLEFNEIIMHGVAARRTARHFGVKYDYGQRTNEPTEPLPWWLVLLRDRCALLAQLAPEALAEALVQRYPPGATIGWHRDSPPFGTVVGVSLASGARMRFRRGSVGNWKREDVELPPCSAYVLSGEVRNQWQHSIPPTPALRYSVTYRTLRRVSST